MAIDPITAKIGKEAASSIKDELGKEKTSWKELLIYLKNMPKELITN
jgi:hypothetical protein